jgi:outer membrane autotransporter protein
MTIKAGVMGGSNLQTGDTITLLHKAGGSFTTNGTTYGTLTEGVSLDYQVAISLKDAQNLIGTIKKASLNPATKSFTETQALGAALINSGIDQLAGSGLQNAIAAASQPGVTGYTPFAAMGGDNMRYNTGSYVDSQGWNISVGMSRVLTNASGKLTLAPVVSYGRSNYDSYLDNGTHGDGSAHYTGLGFLARQDNKDGRYYEGSLSGGHLNSDYSSRSLQTSYDSSANYYALHAGLGQVTPLSPTTTSLDCYGKYFFSHQNGSRAKLATGEDYDFGSIDSHRVRLGARYTQQLHPGSSLYAGLAYQYEFGGDAHATYKGFDTPSPSLKGGSAMLELGWQVKPDQKSPLTLNLSATGWAGKQEGLSFNAGANWAFFSIKANAKKSYFVISISPLSGAGLTAYRKW